jgi:protein TonB
LVEPPVPANALESSSGRLAAHPSDSSQVARMRWEEIGQAVRRQVVYPPLARRRGIQGRTTVRFIVDSTGTPSDVRIVESSGNAILDEAASDAVARATPLPPVASPTQVVVPIVFALH